MAGGNRDKSNLIPVKKEDGKFDSRQRGMRDQQGRAGPTSSKGGVPNMHMNIKKEAAEEIDPTEIEHEVGAEGEQQDQLSSSKKFTGRCRLFVGNLPGNIDENDFKEMFQKFGEVSEVFLNASRSFGFVKLVSGLAILYGFSPLLHKIREGGKKTLLNLSTSSSICHTGSC